MKLKKILNSDSKNLVKKLTKKKSDSKEIKTLIYRINKNNLSYSKLRLIIKNEIRNK